MGECSNTADRGAFIHELPGPARRTSASGAVIWTKLQQDWIRFIKGSRVLDPKTYTHIFICSAHFDESQVQMYRLGLRKKPPQLKPEAVPHLKATAARHPFPPEWFVNKETMAMPLLPYEAKRAKMSAITSDAATCTGSITTIDSAARARPFMKKKTTTTPTETTTTAMPTETTATCTPTETTTATPNETTATTSATSTGNVAKVQRRLANSKCRCRASQRNWKPATNKIRRVRSRSDSIYSRKKVSPPHDLVS